MFINRYDKSLARVRIRTIIAYVIFFMCLNKHIVQAETLTNQPMMPNTKIQTSQDRTSALQLEVKQTPLASVLMALAKQTGVSIHYSVLPEGLVTATCVGSSLKPVLECLLNRKADIIVRYTKNDSLHIAEAWVLGAKLETLPNCSLCQATTTSGALKVTSADTPAEVEAESKPKQSDLLLKIAQTGNPKDRAEAIGNLLAIGGQNDPKIKAMLEEAVHDQDAGVRAQAISTLTHRDDYKENAAQIIAEALQDSSVDVRMMAVDGITDDIDLLQQAANDTDETIRTYALQKLADLRQQQKQGK